MNEIVEFFLVQLLYEMYKLNLNLTIELIVTKGTHGISVVSKLAKIQSVILFGIIDDKRIIPLNAAELYIHSVEARLVRVVALRAHRPVQGSHAP